MNERTREVLKKEIWAWIGSICSIVYWIASCLFKKENYIATSEVPSSVNEWLIKHDYIVVRISDAVHNALIDTGCFCCAGILFYFISSLAIRHGGVICFKSFCRGAFIWGSIASFILIRWFGLYA
jgi:hypothetical protein